MAQALQDADRRSLMHLSRQRILVLKGQRKTLNEMIRTIEQEIVKEHRRYEAWGGNTPAWLIK